MKKNQIILGSVLALFSAIGFFRGDVVLAATTPALGEAEAYGVLANAYTNTSAATTITGSVGFTVGPGVAPAGVQPNYGSGAPYSQAGTDQASAASALAGEACTFTWPAAVDLSTDVTHGPVGVFTPGVYCSLGAMAVTGPLTLSGNGTYIFRAVGALDTTASTVMTLAGASACDIFWTPSGATTLGASSTFFGTVVDGTAITTGASMNWTGRALNFDGAVTTGATTTITVPDCAPPPPPPPLPATLHVIKTVTNDNAGTAVVSDAVVHVTSGGVDVAASPQSGAASPGTSYTLDAGTYVVSEEALAGYTATISGACALDGSITLSPGDDVTCIINNNDNVPPPPPPPPATLHVIKTVVNDGAGTAVAADAIVSVKTGGVDVATSPQAGVGAPGTLYSLPAGAYNVSELPMLGYDTTISGGCDASGNITLVAGQDATCTITNNDVVVIPPPPPPDATINVVKLVINDNGRNKVIADFPLFVGATLVTSGVTNVFAPGTYTISETTSVDYVRTFSGDCNASGQVTITPGDDAVCVVTNNDVNRSSVENNQSPTVIAQPVPPIIDVLKVPSPLALPDGPGLVTYTYTVRNIGTVPITDVSLVGDTCGPIVHQSGDTSGDNELDVNETWIYRCSTTLTETHTNTVVATGWANGLTATDIASATVVVGVPIVPPLIHITKVPSPLVLPAGGGPVTFTMRVTNPGTVAITNIRVSDPQCGPVSYIGGDTNSNSLLDVLEVWLYTCQANSLQTTTNTAAVSGSASGITARDFAIVTVVVAGAVEPVVAAPVIVPKLPNTGGDPITNLLTWVLVSAGGALILCYNYKYYFYKSSSRSRK